MNITNEDVSEYLDGLYKGNNEQLDRFRETSEPNIPIILKSTESLIKSILLIKMPKKILEIGTATGYSASIMAKTLPDCCITTIEHDTQKHDLAKSNFEVLRLDDRIDARLGDAVTIMDNIGEDRYDFIFIDAAKSHYRKFWDSAIKLASPKAVILCDNVLMKASVANEKYDRNGRHKTSIKKMREFLDYITNLKDVDTSVLAVGDGVSISILKK